MLGFGPFMLPNEVEADEVGTAETGALGAGEVLGAGRGCDVGPGVVWANADAMEPAKIRKIKRAFIR